MDIHVGLFQQCQPVAGIMTAENVEKNAQKRDIIKDIIRGCNFRFPFQLFQNIR